MAIVALAQTHQISSRPPLIRPRIHHPQLRKRVIPATLRSIHPTVPEPEKIVRRGHQVLALRLGRGDKGEEAVVQEAALEDEVAERVGEVPDEEEAQRGGGCGAGEDEARRGVGDEDDGEGGEEGDDGGLVEEVGREGRGHF